MPHAPYQYIQLQNPGGLACKRLRAGTYCGFALPCAFADAHQAFLEPDVYSFVLAGLTRTFRVWPRTVGGLLRAAGRMMLGQQAVLRRGSRMIVSHLETYECCPIWRCAAGTNKSAPLGASPAGAQANWAPMSDTGAER